MLVPAAPDGAPLQIIDVRDLADWMLELVERGNGGSLNALGPAGGAAIGWPELIAACPRGAREIGCEPAQPVAVSEALLVQQGVAPWRELPLWLPASDPEFAGFMAVSVECAVALGLRTRPLADIVRGVLAESLPEPGDARLVGKLTREREAELIAPSSF